MKKFVLAIIATVIIFFASELIISPIISEMGYSSAESSYHLMTHALVVGLIFTVIICTMIIVEEIHNIKESSDDDK